MSLAIVLALASLAVAQPQIDASGPPAARFAAAADAYLAGDFATAERLWDALLSEGYTSASLHLNLGNARLRAGRRGTAIASYVRALRLDPGDPDAHHNLELARAANVDRLVGGTGPSLLDRVASRTSNLAAALAFAVPWWLLWVCLSGRLVSGRRARAAWRAASGSMKSHAWAAGISKRCPCPSRSSFTSTRPLACTGSSCTASVARPALRRLCSNMAPRASRPIRLTSTGSTPACRPSAAR